MPPFSFFSSSGKRKRDPQAGQASNSMDLDSLRSLGHGGTGGDEGHPGWPFPGWTRYRFEAFLGKGAMGQVYRVFDPVLNRSVALKVLNERAMIHADRFLSEARAMARVDHPNVAKVFEVGTVEGRPYLTMQLLQGESLHGLRGKLGLEERVEMMRQACEGVQAAHRMGLLHRDLKPSNIVVEKDADGLWHAFVVDFGLACDTVTAESISETKDLSENSAENALDVAASRIQARVGVPSQEAPTATSVSGMGNITGTPAFMSPEQAAGEALDRRSDVFSLGSTLYTILTGVAPFGGQSVLSILGNVALTRPAPLKDFEEKLPQDLEAIVLKAMEKDPLHRYPSARALSLDLERWLNGEAVEAVQRKPFYRLGRWIKKNRSLAGLGALLTLTVLGAVGLGVRASWRAQAQARYYQYFCQEAERMEAKLILAEAMPLHDTLPERKAIQAQMRELEQRMLRAGSVAEAPGHYALGRGYLVLEKLQPARLALEKAWAMGLQTPEVAAALGSCLNQVYSKALGGLSGQSFRERKAALDAELKPQIMNYLTLARSGLQGAEVAFVEAQMAKTEGRLEESLAKVDQVLADDPWNVRALLLKAGIRLDQAGDQTLGSAPLDQAKADLTKAKDIARSSAAVFERQTRLYQMEMNQAIRQRKPFMGYFRQVMETAALARQAHSQSSWAWAAEADAWWSSRDNITEWFWATHEKERDYPEAMRRAIACADRALALEKELVKALNAKGVAHWFLSTWNRKHGLAYQADLDRAISTFSDAVQRPYPTANMYMNLGSCYAIRGNGRKESGVNPLSDYQKALEYYKVCEKNQPNDTLYLNIGLIHEEMAEIYQWQGQDIHEPARQALDYSHRVLVGPFRFEGLVAMARIYFLKAEYAAWLGKMDPDALRLGTDYARQALALHEKEPSAMELNILAHLLASFSGEGNADLKTVKDILQLLTQTPQGKEKYRLQTFWLALERYRKAPAWQGLLALEGQIKAAGRSAEVPKLHLLAFEACCIGLERQAPGATPEQWRSRMKEHIQWAKRLNPLIAPWADRLLKERGGRGN